MASLTSFRAKRRVNTAAMSRREEDGTDQRDHEHARERDGGAHRAEHPAESAPGPTGSACLQGGGLGHGVRLVG